MCARTNTHTKREGGIINDITPLGLTILPSKPYTNKKLSTRYEKSLLSVGQRRPSDSQTLKTAQGTTLTLS